MTDKIKKPRFFGAFLFYYVLLVLYKLTDNE